MLHGPLAAAPPLLPPSIGHSTHPDPLPPPAALDSPTGGKSSPALPASAARPPSREAHQVCSVSEAALPAGGFTVRTDLLLEDKEQPVGRERGVEGGPPSAQCIGGSIARGWIHRQHRLAVGRQGAACGEGEGG